VPVIHLNMRKPTPTAVTLRRSQRLTCVAARQFYRVPRQRPKRPRKPGTYQRHTVEQERWHTQRQTSSPGLQQEPSSMSAHSTSAAQGCQGRTIAVRCIFSAYSRNSLPEKSLSAPFALLAYRLEYHAGGPKAVNSARRPRQASAAGRRVKADGFTTETRRSRRRR